MGKPIGHDNENMTAKTAKGGQKSWGQECWGRTAGTVKSEQENRDRTAREDNRDGAGRTGKRGQDGQNMTART